MGKASKIVSLQFADFPDFMATWLVKATWVNMTLLGAKTSKVRYIHAFILKILTFAK